MPDIPGFEAPRHTFRPKPEWCGPDLRKWQWPFHSIRPSNKEINRVKNNGFLSLTLQTCQPGANISKMKVRSAKFCWPAESPV